jgi:eukaryotic-like serine/threonine-protein kinase
LLNSGTKLGPYEIQCPLGAGGMGEVYRALDTRLSRTVAIKILPSHLSENPEARQRFEREARTISSLSHPNICTLYDVGHQEGTDYLVMEFLEGETLADRIQRGPLPAEQVLKYGVEICEGLEKAHRCGVVHRDLKPGNIMLTKAGAKLMDFGLAKAVTAEKPSSSGLTETLISGGSHPLTAQGTVVGTFQYISPEQVEGKEADARSDIFALGAVLYEMATGKRAFQGKTAASVVAAVLATEPAPICSVQPMAPAALDRVVKTCLAKDPDQRFQNAHDVKLQLNWIAECGPQAALLGPTVGQSGTRDRLAWVVGAAFALLALLFAVLWIIQPRPMRDAYGITRFTISLPEHSGLSADTTQSVVLSPNGRELAYVASENGLPHLYVRSLDRFDSLAIPESEGASFPFFSPDGEWIAFFSQGKLKKASVNGSAPVVVCDLNSFFGGTWTSDGKIIFDDPSLGLGVVPAAGGTPQKVALKDDSKNSHSLTLPRILPNSRWVVFTDYAGTAAQLTAVNLDTGELRLLVKNAEGAYYSSNRLLYYSGGTIWAAPFDLKSVTVTGPAVPVVAGVDERNFVSQFSASQSGILAYAPGVAGNFTRNLFWVDRKGQAQKIDVAPTDYVDPTISPDGKRFAVVLRSVSDQELGVYDAVRDVLMRIPSNGAHFAAPAWTPDGRELVVDASGPNLKHGIYRMPADGSGAPALIDPLTENGHVTSIAGDRAVIMMTDPTTGSDLWTMALDGKHEPQPFRVTPANERQGSLSPDGKWMAYASNESGRSEIYVEPVPGPGGRWQISSVGGEQPRWARDGQEIFYRNGTKMFSVSVQTQGSFAAGKPAELFDASFDQGGAVDGYDVTPDAKAFLMTRSERPNPTEIRVVIGWPQEIAAPGPRP